MLTADALKSVLKYEPESGEFIWIAGQRRGDIAGCVKRTGYIDIKVHGRHYRAHRLAYLYMTGTWPPEMIDHKDGNRNNNSWGNLRAVTAQENSHNYGRPITNSTGFLGVTYNKSARRFQAMIKVHGERKYLGVYERPEEAYEAYLAAKRRWHPSQPEPRLMG